MTKATLMKVGSKSTALSLPTWPLKPQRPHPTIRPRVEQTALSWLLSNHPNAGDTVSNDIKSQYPSLPLVKKK